MRIQVHVDRRIGEAIENAAARKGRSFNNEVKLRLAASLADDNPDLLAEHVANCLRELCPPGKDYDTIARAIVSMVPVDRLPLGQ